MNDRLRPETRTSRALVPLACLLLAAACQSKPKEPEPPPKAETPKPAAAPATPEPAATAVTSAAAPAGDAADAASSAAAKSAASDGGTVVVQAGGSDPIEGKFTLAQATAGLAGQGKLIAEIRTAKGALECELYQDKAPITVANFVGLARGLRPFKEPSGNWVKKPAYDGTTFHRIIKGFMIQGGDPAGSGAGEPGYTIVDELWEGARHDQRGLLCMANRGKDTNGMQFFITDAAAAHLDGGYTIFGKCQPDSVIEALASSPVSGDRADDPPKIESVVIHRGKVAKKAGAAKAK
ncbi:MAG TPA: peptidylprolyl isomerase [Polyangiaceae bacterium]|nr:peptidylprolyl isomerase [Polyangiaceae bacterium]